MPERSSYLDPNPVDELRALPAHQRREILAALSPAERRQLGALLDSNAEPAQAASAAKASAPAPDVAAPEAQLIGLSSWLAERVESGASSGMTAAARASLARAVRGLRTDGPAPTPAIVQEQDPPRTLLSAIGGFFSGRRRHA